MIPVNAAILFEISVVASVHYSTGTGISTKAASPSLQT